MSLKHLTPKQWDAVDAGTPDQQTIDHLATCEECRAVVAESRALLVGLRRTGHAQDPGQQPATDHPAAEDMAGYGDGVLFGAGARSIEEHLEHCTDCRDDIIVMRDIATAGDLKETVSAEVRDQLLKRLSRSSRPQQVTSLGRRFVKISRKLGAVFSPLVPADMPFAGLALASERRLQRPRPLRSNLEDELGSAAHEVADARSMMEHAANRMREASVRVEKLLRAIAAEHKSEVADVAAALTEAVEAPKMMPDVGTTFLELTAADVRLRIQANDLAKPDLFTLTVRTQNGQPVPGMALELRPPDGEPTLRTTDVHGQASFSLERGESTLRFDRGDLWELQLARLS